MNVLLYNSDAEMSVLGSCFIRSAAIPQVRALGLTEDSFYLRHHQIIWRAIGAFEHPDLVLVASWLRERELLQDVGGEDYLIQVAEFVPSASNAPYYAELVLAAARRRKVSNAAQRVVHLASTEPSLQALAGQALVVSDESVVDTGRGQLMEDVPMALEQSGLSTGFPRLDAQVITAGHPCGQLTVIGAPSKGGKTTLMLDMYLHDVREGRRTCYGTFADLDATGIKRRLVTKLTGRSLIPRTLEEVAAYEEAVGWLNSCKNAAIYDGFRNEDDSVESFAAWVEAEHRRAPWSKVYVDYAQELRSAAKCAQFSPEQNQTECARVLVRLARRLEIAVIVGSQLTEGREGMKTKTKWSRSWEEKAGWVLMITTNETGGRVIEVPYSRFGPQSCRLKTIGIGVEFDEHRIAFLQVV